ncbi:MAG: hypothetical protein CMI62_11735 [Parvibaculum sp.]|jgi:prevent-host-death family protein|uniref:type II toxin-antitoxin system Phd/YefM family antitoxin n=1 Tax=Parvibaculum sp. TaxID=2024848 RepID=UPI000C495B2B|nr:type II toxin-antitoxin system prevent-host-death family antitoxin [Parvibaculum sp.]MAU61384.1 hypothetical protein [Parvibaculum sp.]|tara:strand:+ start:10325 stop:10582 length:258 start_codon:yes stop_codon:yes gene_type:complete
MSRISASQVSSISELKRSPARVIEEASEEGAVAILNRNKPVAYVLDPETYEAMLDRLEDYEDMKKVIERQGQSVTYVTLDELDDL